MGAGGEFSRVEISTVRIGRFSYSRTGGFWSGIFTRKWDLTFHPIAIHKDELEAERAHSASLPSSVPPHNTGVAAGHFLLGSLIDRSLVLTESMNVYGLSTSLPEAVYWGSSNLTV